MIRQDCWDNVALTLDLCDGCEEKYSGGKRKEKPLGRGQEDVAQRAVSSQHKITNVNLIYTITEE